MPLKQWNNRSRISLEMKGIVKIENLLIPGQLLVQSHVQRISHSQGLHHGWAGGRQGPSPSWEAGLQSRYAKVSRSTCSVVLSVLQECREFQIVLLNNSANFKMKYWHRWQRIASTFYLRNYDDAMLIVPEAAVLSREAARLLPDTAAIIWKNIQHDLWLIWWRWHRRHHRRC